METLTLVLIVPCTTFCSLLVQKVAATSGVQLCTPVVPAMYDTWGHREVPQSCVPRVPWAVLVRNVRFEVFAKLRHFNEIAQIKYLYTISELRLAK